MSKSKNPPINYENLYELVNNIISISSKNILSLPYQDLLTQKICAPLNPYLINIKINSRKDHAETTLKELLNRRQIQISNNTLKVKSRLKIKYYSLNFFLLCYSILYVLIRSKIKSDNYFNLIYGLSKDMIFKNSHHLTCDVFFEKVNSSFKNKDSINLIQYSKFDLSHVKTKGTFKVVTYIPLYLLRYSDASRIVIAYNLVIRFFYWQRLCKKISAAILIGPEIIIDSYPTDVQSKIRTLSTTVSQWGVQPFYFHTNSQAQRDLYWYSSNSLPPTNNLRTKIKEEFSYLKYMKIDRHIVWTHKFGRLVKEITNSKYKVIDYVLFYLPNRRAVSKSIDILIFDVTPKKFYSSKNYYSDSNCIKFVNDILLATESKAVNIDALVIALKPKRKIDSSHSGEYRRFLKKLKSQNRIRLIDPNIDLFEVIQQAKIVVAIPFTTPALIAKRLGVRSCYYNPAINFKSIYRLDTVPIIITFRKLQKFINKKD
jgi:polysaccharide biosynthesis PFTS motif protein